MIHNRPKKKVWEHECRSNFNIKERKRKKNKDYMITNDPNLYFSLSKRLNSMILIDKHFFGQSFKSTNSIIHFCFLNVMNFLIIFCIINLKSAAHITEYQVSKRDMSSQNLTLEESTLQIICTFKSEINLTSKKLD